MWRMNAFVDRMKTIGERLPGRTIGTGTISCSLPARQPRSRAAPMVVLLIAIVAVAVAAAVLLARDHSVGSLLGSHPASASAPSAASLPPTQLVALPPHTLVNGTDSLTVTLSAPAAANSPTPTLRPAVAGTWSTVGDSEVFTPASTLMPCSTYTIPCGRTRSPSIIRAWASAARSA